jgi:hypothetical protein
LQKGLDRKTANEPVGQISNQASIEPFSVPVCARARRGGGEYTIARLDAWNLMTQINRRT